MKTFITIVLILLVLRWLLKPLLKIMFFATVNKMANEAMRRQQPYQDTPPRRKEGTISVDYIPSDNERKNNNKTTDNRGDYVDYEEVK
jgi:hypothetical protein